MKQPSIISRILECLSAAFLLFAATGVAFGQAGLGDDIPFHQPLNQQSPPGMAGRWARVLGRSTPDYLQPIQIVLPTKGNVTFHLIREGKAHSEASPAFARVAVGALYRVKISDMPELPGKSLYPSIEIIDRLHPPRGKADAFPVPIKFTVEEIELAARGRLITKVVYLEQPQIAARREAPVPVTTLPPNRNLILEADRLGRPMAIVRLGARQPTEENFRTFFGPGGPIQFRTEKKAK